MPKPLRLLASLLVFLLLASSCGGSGVACVNYWCWTWDNSDCCYDSYAIEVADLDGDGQMDVVSSASGNPDVTVRMGKGGGEFEAAVAVPMALAGADLLRIADFDGDSKLDVLAVDGAAAQVQVCLGDGTGAFPTAVAPVTISGMSTLQAVAVGSINGDTSSDAILLDDAGGVIGLLAMGAGVLAEAPAGRNALLSNGLDLVGARFNADGTTDVLVAEAASNSFSIYSGDATGAFTLTQGPVVLPFVVRHFALGEFNGAPGIDAAVLAENGQVQLYFGNGDGTVTASSQEAFPVALDNTTRILALPNPSNPTAPADLAVVGAFSSGFFVAEIHNDGTGTFDVSGTPTSIRFADAFRATDLNGDEHVDLVSISDGGFGVGLGQTPSN